MEVANRILEGKYLNESEGEEDEEYNKPLAPKKPEEEMEEMENQFKSQALKIIADEEKNEP